MNKQTIITILFALVAMAGLAQTKTVTVTGYSPALKDGTLVARNQVSEYPPLSKLAGCFLCTTVRVTKIRNILDIGNI